MSEGRQIGKVVQFVAL